MLGRWLGVAAHHLSPRHSIARTVAACRALCVTVRSMANQRAARPSTPRQHPPEVGTTEFFALLASLDGDEAKIESLAYDIADEHIASCTDSAEIRDAAWPANANNEVATAEAARSAGFTDAKALRMFNDCYDRSINGAAKAQEELDQEWDEMIRKEDAIEAAKRYREGTWRSRTSSRKVARESWLHVVGAVRRGGG